MQPTATQIADTLHLPANSPSVASAAPHSHTLYAEVVRQIAAINSDGSRLYHYLTLLWSDQDRSCLVRTLGEPMHASRREIYYGFNRYQVRWI